VTSGSCMVDICSLVNLRIIATHYWLFGATDIEKCSHVKCNKSFIIFIILILLCTSCMDLVYFVYIHVDTAINPLWWNFLLQSWQSSHHTPLIVSKLYPLFVSGLGTIHTTNQFEWHMNVDIVLIRPGNMQYWGSYGGTCAFESTILLWFMGSIVRIWAFNDILVGSDLHH
jgi:hypothetical protein